MCKLSTTGYVKVEAGWNLVKSCKLAMLAENFPNCSQLKARKPLAPHLDFQRLSVVRQPSKQIERCGFGMNLASLLLFPVPTQLFLEHPAPKPSTSNLKIMLKFSSYLAIPGNEREVAKYMRGIGCCSYAQLFFFFANRK